MKQQQKFSLSYYLLVFLSIVLMESIFFSGTAVKEISYSQFRNLLTDNRIKSVIIESDRLYGLEKAQALDENHSDKNSPIFQPPRKKAPWHINFGLNRPKDSQRVERQFVVTRLDDPHLIADLQEHGVDYRGKIESHWLSNFIANWILPMGLFIVLGSFLARRKGKGAAGFLDVGKNKARIYAVDPSQKVTFDDVAGVDEAVEEVKEVVSFLENPQRFTRLGAKLPKGILLVGPPGTGKTLLARAVAGEAGVPFFNLSGSDFVEMFVGVGAARVRDLFKDAKAKAPCIIFIDELDAVGKNRSQGAIIGGNDERENTLNQLLTEMDGFDPQSGIIIMGATNRPEVLDPALLRPGRFDRQILVDRPDLDGRMEIFKVHTRDFALGPNVDFRKLAAETPGFAGAEIANVCNEAALLASRKDRQAILQADFQDAIERVIAGLEKKNKLINPHERKVVAYHESGHAIVGHLTAGSDPVQKVSIIPRGIGALGYTLQTPLEDRFLMSRTELLGKIKGLLGGRAAEDIIFGDVSTGASNDLEKVADIVRNMLTVYGMSEQMPNRSLVEKSSNPFLGQGPSTQRRSEDLEALIDKESQTIINDAYQEARKIVTEHRSELEAMAALLLEKEKIDGQDIKRILDENQNNKDQAAA
ncbi:FtsH1: cell division protease [Desulfosarcina variabilis str. Montpellier]|uniref:ATP-dependent zinc metalloprotease FtsH n=1 Tax=Desulfosarcina variabilis TaxID=2300 RepID=UPI003AFB233C